MKIAILKAFVCVSLILNSQFSILNSVQAQDTLYARHVIQQLSSEQFHGRGYSYRGDSIAAEFIRGELRRLGVKPLGDDYYQPYTFSVFSMEGPLSLRVNGQKVQSYVQYRVPAWSQSTWGDYKVVSVPVQILTDHKKLKKFLDRNDDMLQDIFIYIDASKLASVGEEKSREVMGFLQGLRLRNPFNSKGIIVAVDELNTYSPANTDFVHGYAYIEVLASAMPKKIKNISCSIFTQFHANYPTQNVCGIVEGEVDTMVVLTAHYDHLGTMGDSVTFYGAHDNASGVAAVLDLARMAVVDKPHYTQVFYFFSGEEAGLKGSKYGSSHPLFDFSKVRLLLNIDMFCGGDEGIMVFNAESDETKPFFNRLKVLNDAMRIAPEIRPRANRPNSDHWYFSQKMPAIFVLSMGQHYGGYHDPNDRCEECSLVNYANYLTLISSLTF